MIGILISQIAISILLASVFLFRPSLTSATGWKIVAFIGLCILPGLCIVGGMDTHIQRSETTQFCTSCHVMVPYRQSLNVNDTNHIPAQHFQNHRVPANMACYSCHADYTLYGPLKDKMQGLKRIYVDPRLVFGLGLHANKLHRIGFLGPRDQSVGLPVFVDQVEYSKVAF